MTRKALLLGIDAYEEDALRLEAAGRDVRELAKALALAGFEPEQVRAVVGSQDAYLSTANLRKQIMGTLTDGRPGDELLIYFSGHGIEQAGRRSLLPQDFDPGQPADAASLIGDIALYELARSADCRADAVIFVIDACRNNAPLPALLAKSFPPAPSVPPDPGAETPSIVFLFSCAAGEVSHATDGDQAMSFFTRALCEALTADDDNSTLAELCAAVQRRLDKTLPPMAKPQTATLGELRCPGRGGDPLALLLKDNPATRLRQRIGRSDWVRRIQDGPLMGMVATAGEGLAIQLKALITETEDLCRTQREALPAQRWRDDEMPARAVQRLELLLRGEPEPWLTPAEAAVSVAIPHVYEAILAAAEQRLQQDGNPLAPDGYPPEASRMALALRNRFASEAAHERRRELLRRRGLDAAADDLAAWQLLRFLHESGEVWDYPPTPTGGGRSWISRVLDPLFAPAAMAEVAADDRVPRVLDGGRLVALARLAFAGFDDIQLEAGRERGRQLRRDRCFGEGQAQLCVDEIKLAHLVNLAFGLALDAPRLPALLAEHLGVDLFVTAKSLRTTLSTAEWHRGDNGLSLHLDCPHEALDAALETHVRDLDEHLSRLAREQVLAPDLLSHLPRRLNDNISPHRDDDRPRFARPHLTFTLDQARVRELLMGENLYGDPALALRELYQNALDACRYRRTRERWLRHEGRLGEQEPFYKGRIIFRAGTADGRAYIECEDNGIGMADRHLRGLFAQAGRRFADSHEFHLEQADWDAAGIPFFPNSRFGIGVFSYFMLADEVVVESRRLADDGLDRETGIRAQVVGSGSLFRLQPFNGEPRGTRVRLYLNRSDLTSTKLLEGITEWLWVPEFDVEIEGPPIQHLSAGAPGPKMVKECGELIPIPESAGDGQMVRIWWARGKTEAVRPFTLPHSQGRLLADGVAAIYEGKPVPSHCVVNLCEALRPTLSVDRNRIVEWTAGASWLEAVMRDHGWRALLGDQAFELDRLGTLFDDHSGAMWRLDRMLRTQPQTHVRGWGKTKKQVAVALGLFERDRDIMEVQDGSPVPELRGGLMALPFSGRVLVTDQHPSLIGLRLLRGRSAAIDRAGLEVPEPFRVLARFDQDAGIGNPPLGASTMLETYLPEPEEHTKDVDLDPSSLQAICAVHACAAKFSIAISEAADLARSLVRFGLPLAGVDEASRLAALSDDQLQLLSRDGDGRAPWRSSITPAQSIACALNGEVSRERIVETIASLADLGLETQGLSLTVLEAVPDVKALTELQRLLLSRDADGKRPFSLSISCGRLLRVAETSDLQISAVIKEARYLVEMLGVDLFRPTERNEYLALLVLDSEPQPRWSSADLIEATKFFNELGIDVSPLATEADILQALEPRCRQLLGFGVQFRGQLLDFSGKNSILRAALGWSLSLRQVHEIAEPLRAFGFQVGEPGAGMDAFWNDTAPIQTLRPMEDYIDWNRRRLDPFMLAACCVKHNKAPADFREPLELLQAVGIDADECLRFLDFCAAERGGALG